MEWRELRHIMNEGLRRELFKGFGGRPLKRSLHKVWPHFGMSLNWKVWSPFWTVLAPILNSSGPILDNMLVTELEADA